MTTIRPGTYLVRARDVAHTETREGKPQISLTLDFVDEHNDPTGESIVHFLHMFGRDPETERRNIRRALDSLAALGWDADDLVTFNGVGSKTAEAVIELEEYNGGPRARVKWINVAGASRVQNVLPPDRAKAFAASMRGEIAAFRKDKGMGTVARAAGRFG